MYLYLKSLACGTSPSAETLCVKLGGIGTSN
jgi:hypothetical protein